MMVLLLVMVFVIAFGDVCGCHVIVFLCIVIVPVLTIGSGVSVLVTGQYVQHMHSSYE